GNHAAYDVGFDLVDGRLEHWFAQPLASSRTGRYTVLSTTLDRADVRAFCAVSVEHSGVTRRRFFQRRSPADRFVVARPTEEGDALAVHRWQHDAETSIILTDVDEAL